MSMKKKILIIMGLLMAILLFGCSDDKDGKNAPEKEAGDQIETGQNDRFISPLTGLETNVNINNRIVSVMVNNHPDARPQTGLSKADIVFEVLAEGSITRFLALYHSEHPDVVGPVRSAREYYFNLADQYDALYVYHGAAEFVNDMINEQEVEYINGALHDDDGILFKRESFRKAPHNSYLQFDAVHDIAEESGYETTYSYDKLPFVDEEKTIDGANAENVKILYPGRKEPESVEYKYVESNGNYIRYDAQEQTVELETEDPIELDNIFIIEAHHEVIDDEGRRSINLNDGGKAQLIQKGIVQDLEWENVNGRIIPVKDGEEVGFVNGKTWINVVPTSPGIDQIVSIQ